MLGLVDQSFSELDKDQCVKLNDYLMDARFENGFYSGVQDRLLECIWESKARHYKNLSSSSH